MSKRAPGYERSKNDLYRTWNPRAVAPLLPFLPSGTRFLEPCAGHGDLIGLLQEHGHFCVGAWDIAPHDKAIKRKDARKLIFPKGADCIITNPPWTRTLLHQLILAFYWQLPTWLLFDADWAHTEQARPYLPMCRKIVSVGRLKWQEGSAHQGKDNCSWYLFAVPPEMQPYFYGRVG